MAPPVPSCAAILSLVLAASTPPALAQDPVIRPAPGEAAVDAIFHRYDNRATPGCSVAVIDGGRTVLKKSYGMADVSLGVPRTSRTSNWIPYSEARVFVALAVAMLAREGRFSLDDAIRDYLPELPTYAADVTIRHLLHHTSGLADYGVLAGPGFEISDRLSEDEFFRILRRWNKLGFEPGQSRMYSNTDYALLKVLAERSAGSSLHDYLHARLLGPSGMADTRIGADQADTRPGHALFHEVDGDGYRRLLRYRTNLVGEISVTTSLDDLVRWDAALRDPALGLASMLHELEAGALPSEAGEGAAGDAFGVYRRVHKGLPLVEYRGVSAYTYLVQVPGTGLSVATLCQTNLETGWLAAEVARLYVDPPSSSGDSHGRGDATSSRAPVLPGPAVEVPIEELQQYAGTYRSADGSSLVAVAVDGDRLAITPDGGPEFPDVLARGDGRFTTVLGGALFLITFARGQDGVMTVTSWDLTHDESGGDTLRRWTQWQPDALALHDYAGTYVGEDVEVILHVRTDGEHVLVASRGLAETMLLPLDEPDFFDRPSAYTTRFERNGEGRVVALVLDATRVKGMRFTRRPD